MTLQINNPEADKLAHDLAARGKNVDDIVLQALRREAGQSHPVSAPQEDFSVEEVMKIARRCAALPDYDTRSPDEILGYDELGLPT